MFVFQTSSSVTCLKSRKMCRPPQTQTQSSLHVYSLLVEPATDLPYRTQEATFNRTILRLASWVRKLIIRILVHLLSWLEQVPTLRASHSEEGHRESRVAAGWEGVYGRARISPERKCHKLAPNHNSSTFSLGRPTPSVHIFTIKKVYK